MRARDVSLRVGLVCSGAAALLYESSWTRMLHQVFGVGDVAVATVLAVFFLGLGLGAALGGRLAGRLTRPARAYAAIEVAVAALALLTIVVVPAVRSAYESVAHGTSPSVLMIVRWAFASIVLLPATTLMGATIPVLARAAAHQDGWAREVTGLYVANTAGAILGAAVAGFWSIPEIGLRASLVVAAAASVVAAAIVAFGLRRDPPIAPAPVRPSAPAGAGPGETVRLATALAFLSGATALAGEVLWTRVLRIVVHATTAAFAAMLVNYLAGIAIGAWIAPRLAARLGARRAFGAVQLCVVLAFGAAMAYAPHLPRLVPLIRHEPSLVPHETGVLLLISSLLLAPLAILTGTGLPLAWAIDEPGHDAARESGRLLASNTIGGLLGSLGTAFLLIPELGTEASLLVVATGCALSSGIALRSASEELRGRALGLVAPAAALALLFLARPTIDLPFLLASATSPIEAVIQGPGERWSRDLVFLREGRNTTVTVRRSPGGLTLFNDGRPESGFGAGEPGFGEELALLGALPGLFAESRGDALIIGLGGGHTSAVALATGFERLRVVELEMGVVDAARLLYEARDRPFALDDPRATLVVDDARNQLALADEDSLDAVISQPSHPWLAGSAALYTREFFGEVARALRPGGVIALWINLFRTDVEAIRSVLATLTAVFPHVQTFAVEETSLIFAASESPFEWGRADERLRTMPATASYLAPHRLGTATALAAALELDEPSARTFGEGAELVLDDRPTIEFRLARQRERSAISLGAIDRVLADRPWLSEGASLLREERLADAIEARIDRVATRRLALARVAATLGAGEIDADRRALLDGRIAEARGDIGGALAAYAARESPATALAEDRLRLAEGDLDALVARARSRDVLPEQATPILEAACALDRPDAVAVALDVARRVDAADDRPLTEVLEAYASGGCGALLAQPALDGLARASARLAFLGQRCALLAGDRARALELEQRAWRRRSVEANELTSLGRAALDGGNGGLAWVLLSRALEIYPSSSGAAIALATLHRRDGRPELAREVLVRAWRDTEGLPEARARIAGAADSLQLDLRDQGVEVQTDVSSAAPSAPEPASSP